MLFLDNVLPLCCFYYLSLEYIQLKDTMRYKISVLYSFNLWQTDLGLDRYLFD